MSVPNVQYKLLKLNVILFNKQISSLRDFNIQTWIVQQNLKTIHETASVYRNELRVVIN